MKERKIDPLDIYLREIGQTPLLSKEEEVALFIKLEKAKDNLFKKILFLKSIRVRMLVDLKKIALGKSHNPRLKIDEDKDNIRADHKAAMALLKKIRRIRKVSRLWNIIRRSGVYFSLYQLEQWVSGLADKNPIVGELSKCSAIKDNITNANLRLVVTIAKCYQKRSSLGLLDLIQEGNVGLMKAVSKFSHVFGNKLSTYASWWIRQQIERAIINQGWIIRVPGDRVGDIKKLRWASRILAQTLGCEPTYDELARKLQWKKDKVKKVDNTVHSPLSLETPHSDDSDEVLGDFVADKTEPLPEDKVADKRLKERVRYFLSRLSIKEKNVLKMYFGIGVYYNDDKNSAEIGRQLGVTREFIRQIKKEGLKKLERLMRREGGPKGRRFFANIKT